jgi:hypothetical protein
MGILGNTIEKPVLVRLRKEMAGGRQIGNEIDGTIYLIDLVPGECFLHNRVLHIALQVCYGLCSDGGWVLAQTEAGTIGTIPFLENDNINRVVLWPQQHFIEAEQHIKEKLAKWAN